MKIQKTNISDVLVIKPNIYKDTRGYFFESWNENALLEQSGIDAKFVQDNHSRSSKNVLRGLHYQIIKPQGKLLRVVNGAVLDIVVDIRKSSPTFGEYFSIILSNNNNLQLWSPPGMAHGFIVLSDSADFLYKTTEYFEPNLERCILWDDKDLSIDWNLKGSKPLVSDKDKAGCDFINADFYD